MLKTSTFFFEERGKESRARGLDGMEAWYWRGLMSVWLMLEENLSLSEILFIE
jgi:hypothetical protein